MDENLTRSSLGSTRPSKDGPLELPSRPPGLTVRDWRQIGMRISIPVNFHSIVDSMSSCEHPHMTVMKQRLSH